MSQRSVCPGCGCEMPLAFDANGMVDDYFCSGCEVEVRQCIDQRDRERGERPPDEGYVPSKEPF